MAMGWVNASNAQGADLAYVCGHCGNRVGAAAVYLREQSKDHIRICPTCSQPSFFLGGEEQLPGVAFGSEVLAVPPLTDQLYEEARKCMAVPAHTAAVMLCRKVLMHVAVEVGAEEGQSFATYVRYLAENNYVPPNARGWVDHIRDKGNEANHEIVLMSRQDAEELVSFTEMLLKLVYEFPSRVPQASQAPP